MDGDRETAWNQVWTRKLVFDLPSMSSSELSQGHFKFG